MSTGIKYDSGKAPLDLLSTVALIELARVLDFGAKKYGRSNWRGGLSECRLIAAALRHMFAYLAGEDLDPESGLPHPAHAMACIMFLLDQHPRLPALDDRYKSPEAKAKAWSESQTTPAKGFKSITGDLSAGKYEGQLVYK